MTAYNIVSPAALVAGQPEDISVLLANLQAIQSVINGNVDNSNIAAAAAILASKIAGYPSDASKFLRGDGTWAGVGGGGYSLVTIDAANTDLAAPTGLTNYWQTTSTGGGSLRSIGAPVSGAGTVITIRSNSASVITLLDSAAGGAGAQLAINKSGNKFLPFGGSVQLVYNGSAWVEINRPAWELIQTITLGANGTFSFQNIPQVYSHLELRGNVRSTNANTVDTQAIRFNNDSGANYWAQEISANGAAAYATGNATQSAFLPTANEVDANTAAAGIFTPVVIHIPGYSSSAWQKTLYMLTRQAATAWTGLVSGRWSGTAAINRIDYYAVNAGSNFLLAGSTLSLYGIT